MTRPPVTRVDTIGKTCGRFVALDAISFEGEQAEIFGPIGPNGAGKTTTMECVEGLRAAERGTMLVLGIDPLRDAYTLRERIGIQLQEAQFLRRIRVRRRSPNSAPAPGSP